MEDKEPIVPPQETGAKTDTTNEVVCATNEEAQTLFNVAKQRLLNVSDWKTISGTGSASFQLTDEKGNELNRTANKGDFIKISIPGPSNPTADGNDWVQIESMEEINNDNDQHIAIKVRPASAPINNDDKVSHFFKDDATSTFMVERKDLAVRASVHGRNEKANTDVDGLIDKARNTMVAVSAQAGASKIQWSLLVKGLLGE